MSKRGRDNAVGRLIDQYDIEAPAYREYWSPVLHPIGCAFVDWLPERRIRSLVDIGTGTGSLLPVLQAKYTGAQVVGVDRSEGMISLADGRLAVMDGCELAIATRTFDLAVVNFTLFHFPDPVCGLAECRRILRPGGLAAVTTWAGDLASPIVSIWNEELDAHGAVAADSVKRLANHELMDTPEKVTNLLESAGFTSVRAEVSAFVCRTRIEDFNNLRMTVGSTRVRDESLDEATRAALLERVQKRSSVLSPDDLDMETQIIFAAGETNSSPR